MYFMNQLLNIAATCTKAVRLLDPGLTHLFQSGILVVPDGKSLILVSR